MTDGGYGVAPGGTRERPEVRGQAASPPSLPVVSVDDGTGPLRSSTSRSGPESLALCKHGPVSGDGRRVALGFAGLLAGLTAGACGRAPAGPHSRVDTATASNICTVIIGNEPPPGGRSIAGPEFCAPAIAQASHASRAVVWRLYYVTRSDSSLQSGIWRRWIPEATVAGLRRHP